MSRKKTIFLFLFLIIFLAACGGSSDAAYSESVAAEAPAYYEEEAELAYDTDDAFSGDLGLSADAASSVSNSTESDGESVSTAGETSRVQTQERLIIRDANLSLVVADTDSAIATITDMVEADGGWVVSSNVYQYDADSKTGSITVRVPATGFTSAIKAMKGLAIKVESESTSGQDVTDEFVDLTLQLENLEATADRVRSFLDDANTVEEALTVNVELSRLEGDIERIKGRRQFLSQSATFSTITISLTPDVLSQPFEVVGWQPKGVAREAVERLISELQNAADFLIWLVIFVLPFVLIYGVPLWVIGRLVRRWWKKRKVGETAVSDSNDE